MATSGGESSGMGGGMMGGGGTGMTPIAAVLSDMAGSGLSAHFANREANQSWQRQKAIMKSRYTWMVGDLKRAGLNPILALGGSPSGGSAPQSSQPAIANVGSRYMTSAKELALLSSQQRNVDANTLKTEAETTGIESGNQARILEGKLYEALNRGVDFLVERFRGGGGSAKAQNALEPILNALGLGATPGASAQGVERKRGEFTTYERHDPKDMYKGYPYGRKGAWEDY